jgi:two-component system NtrC family response regulator/two-component system nitrogen regulation response regulator GlnG
MLVDDDVDLRRTLGPHLSDLGHEVLTVESAEGALNQVADFKPDIVFSDVQMPGMNGFELLSKLRAARPEIDVVIITGYGGVQGAIDAIKDGASDYLLKPLDLDEIEAVIERCMEDRWSRGAVENVEEDPGIAQGGLVGRHPAMLSVYKTIGAVSASRAVVLIRGETGTGKELIARTIHENSADSEQPFIAINCAAVPETLLESTLFGHVRGAFTGASSDRRGPFEMAEKGTIFLDEIGDTGLALQAKLLRVLEEREFYPVGSEEPRTTDARVIAASNKDLGELVRKGEFREDLYFRLRVVEVAVPPLRDRRSDIPLLIRHILSTNAQELGRQVPSVSQDVMSDLIAQDWPGNVRELENTLVRALVMSRGNTLSMHDLEGDHWAGTPDRGQVPREASPVRGTDAQGDEKESLAAVERRHVQRVILMTKGNKSAAARILEVSRPTLNRMIKDYELYVP